MAEHMLLDVFYSDLKQTNNVLRGSQDKKKRTTGVLKVWENP